MKMTHAGKVHYLEPELFAMAGISSQGFTTRHEGVSRPPYNSLNLGTNTLDNSHSVQGNRSILARAFDTRLEKVVTVTQVHGTDLLVLDAPNPDYSHFLKLECDGIVTNQRGVMIGICVADCAPILLLDPVTKAVAALHAGWKGTAGKIARKGVETLVSLFGASPADILAAVGPAIGRCCYEVDAPVKDAFSKQGEGWGEYAVATDDGRWQLDLPLANVHQLLEAGLARDNIETTELCVSCEKDTFFSYRRDGGETGRQMGFIMLK
ncbi:MAG TPA: peptidoglycan editing factor PgeF [Geobacteraceae bacterium]